MEDQTKQPSQPAQQANSQPAPSQPAAGKTNTMAIIAIICAIIVAPVGLILGIISLSQIKKSKEGGKGLATAAIVISVIIMLVQVLSLVLFWGAIFSIDRAAKEAGVNVNTQSGTVTATKDGNTTTMGSDVKLPAGFPSDMPIYGGATLVTANKSNEKEFYIIGNSSDTPEKVAAYYKNTLPQKGWTIDNTSDTSSEFGTGSYLELSNATQTAKVNIYGDSKEKTVFSISITPKSE